MRNKKKFNEFMNKTIEELKDENVMARHTSIKVP